VLYPCDLVLISRFGWLMSVLLAAASVSDLILTPALLAGPMGALIERTTSRAAPAPAVKPLSTAPAPATVPAAASQAEPVGGDAARSPVPAPHIDQRRIRISRPEN